MGLRVGVRGGGDVIPRAAGARTARIVTLSHSVTMVTLTLPSHDI